MKTSCYVFISARAGLCGLSDADPGAVPLRRRRSSRRRRDRRGRLQCRAGDPLDEAMKPPAGFDKTCAGCSQGPADEQDDVAAV
jgi:hypothetical protein